VFPFFVLLMGVPSEYALAPLFVLSCVLAGILVGFVNILITRITVGKRLNIFTERMVLVKSHILAIARGDDASVCTPESCSITVDSDDAFGQSAQAFNQLITSFSSSLQTQATLRQYSEILSSQLDLAMLGKNALELLITYAGADAGAILIETEGELKVIASIAIKNVQSLTDNSLILSSFKELKQLQFNLPEDIHIESLLTEFRPREMIIEPIKYKNVPLGVVVLATARQFSSELKSELDIFAYGLALALHNALEHDQLQKLAALDPLTGCLNRRFGLIRLHEEFVRSVRSSVSIGVAMFDIDHFKQVNDTYGHVAGDRVLKNIARVARMALREGDMLVRYGGEEFLLILPGASREDAFKITERLRYIVRESQVVYGDAKIRVTVSAGCDAFPESNVDSDQALIIRADEALYRAKESGRDKVELY
jgi:two-component system cell cycle response regulator